MAERERENEAWEVGAKRTKKAAATIEEYIFSKSNLESISSSFTKL